MMTLTSCAAWQGSNSAVGFSPNTVLPNPLLASTTDHEFLWNQLVDTLDDYFKIEREVRIRNDGGVVTDGLLETFPTSGSTYLEPWRRDSTAGFEKLHASLQSVRRRATVRVSPGAGGFSIDVAVYKELEDMAQPERASVGASTVRHDGSLVRNEPNAIQGPTTLGWIPLGRDATLEQRLLAEIQGRLAVTPGTPPTHRLPALAP